MQGSNPEGKGDGFTEVSQRQVSLPPHQALVRAPSHQRDWAGGGFTTRASLLAATVAHCMCFSAVEQLQQDVVTVSIAV